MSPSIWIDKKDLVGWSTARSYQKNTFYMLGRAIAGGGTITILNPQNFSCRVVEWRTWVLHLAAFSLQGTVRPISLVCCHHCLGFRYIGLLSATFSNDAAHHQRQQTSMLKSWCFARSSTDLRQLACHPPCLVNVAGPTNVKSWLGFTMRTGKHHFHYHQIICCLKLDIAIGSYQ